MFVATASASQTGNEVDHLIDGKNDTRWAAEGNQYAILDLGAKRIITSVKISFNAGESRIYPFTIEVSEDGQNWTQAISAQNSGTTQTYEEYLVSGFAYGRYLKYNGNGSNVNKWNNIWGIKVYGIDNVLKGTPTNPPVTTATVAPSPNVAGWNKNDVTVTLSALDGTGRTSVQSVTYRVEGTLARDPVTVQGRTASILIAEEGITSLKYYAVDTAGNKENEKMLTFKLDKTPPIVNFQGGGTYTVSQAVYISCSAEDRLSGLTMNPCGNALISAPAYTLGLGTQILTVTVSDQASNTASYNISYTVEVTYDSLCELTTGFLTQNGKEQLANSLCSKLQGAKDAANKGNQNAASGKIEAYIHEVGAQKNKAFTNEQADLLVKFSNSIK